MAPAAVSRASDLVSEFRAFLDGLGDPAADGGEVDEVALKSLLDRIPQEAPALNRPALEALDALVHELIEVCEQRRDSMGAELERLRSGRSALRGYSHLRAHKTEQKLFRKV